MKLLVEINEYAYDWIKNGFPTKEEEGDYLIEVIQNGIVQEE